VHPSDFGRDAPIDLGEQESLYWAALEAVASAPWIEGLLWWNWPANDPGGASNADYTPRGKPAADLLRRAWSDDAPL
jgi:hypothetical protein